jgi:hypothetical protein
METRAETKNTFYNKLFTLFFWFISLTWGIILTLPGLLITLFIIIFLKGKVHKNGCSYIVEFGGNWGGVEIGAVSICGNYSQTDKEWFEHVRRHEFGHAIQQLIFGPFQIFLVSIPSAIRYWYRRLTPNKKHKDYDAIWFEGTATKLGTFFINNVYNGK